jgi:hypothetical protein
VQTGFCEYKEENERLAQVTESATMAERLQRSTLNKKRCEEMSKSWHNSRALPWRCEACVEAEEDKKKAKTKDGGYYVERREFVLSLERRRALDA